MNRITIILLLLTAFSANLLYSQSKLPYLSKKGHTTQLIVNDKPFLMLGGELGNSSASDMKYMADIWPKLIDLKVNTLLAPVYWELIEPSEGNYTFKLVDDLIIEARKNKIKLVLLWFGSWKNSMSCYAPAWVKTDLKRFPRAKSKQGVVQEIMSPFYPSNLMVDLKAYNALLQHLAYFDSKDNTVIMIQVENEIGMLPDVRDYSDAANRAYTAMVPKQLIEYIANNEYNLAPEFLEIWKNNGSKTTGTWEEVFGKSIATEEIYMAWHYAVYVHEIARTGKDKYNIPVYVNAALNRQGYQPGQYPSAGPLPHLIDVWKAVATSIDIYSPDIYFPDFENWCQKYHRMDNPLFIPEAKREPEAAMKAFYAFGQHEAMGFSPFSIESTNDAKNEPLAMTYNLLSQISPVILDNQGQGKMAGFIFDHTKKETSFELGGYKITAKHVYTLGWSTKAKDTEWQMTGGMIINIAPNEFLITGSGIVITFAPKTDDGSIVGILQVEEGKYVDNKWVAGRRMNGDEDHQGRHVRIFENEYMIQKVKLYTYK